MNGSYSGAKEVAMRGLLRSLSLALLLAVGVGQGASADPILVADGRLLSVDVTVNGRDPIFDSVTPSAPFAPLDGVATATAADGNAMARTTATQRSSVSSTRFNASGSAESFANAPTSGEIASGAGTSIFDISFVLSTARRFALTDFMAVTAFESNDEPNEVLVFLSNESTSAFVFSDGIGFGTLQLNRTGVLGAGTYRLYAEADTESNGFIDPDSSSGPLSHHKSSFDLDFQLTPVPEPGSMLLLGTGLVALASGRVRRRVNVRKRSQLRNGTKSFIEVRQNSL
jgi:hypothetical protein